MTHPESPADARLGSPHHSSTLGNLVSEEASGSRSSSELWLEKWIGARADGLTPAFVDALNLAVPALAQFRRVLRNFALGHPLEAGVVNSAPEGDSRFDAALREQLLRCYLFILCRAAARHPFWERAYQRFLFDDLKLFAVPSLGVREKAADQNRLKGIVVDIATDVHSWITSAYSVYGVAAPWPLVPELNLNVLVSRPGNFRSSALGQFEGEVHEYLLPALAALRRFGSDISLTRLGSLRRQQIAASRGGSEFRHLVTEVTRLSDARRQVFFRLYAMLIERILWLANETLSAETSQHQLTHDSADLAGLGRQIDKAIDTGRFHAVAQSATRLAEWVSDELKQTAGAKIRRPGGRRGPLARMAFPTAVARGQPTVVPLSVQFAFGDAPHGAHAFTVRVPEHELPKTVHWYEVEIAVYAEQIGLPATLTRLPGVSSDATTIESGNQCWATYEMILPDEYASLLPSGGKEIGPGAAWRASHDGRGAYVFIIIGEVLRTRMASE